ncbi:MAG: HAD-IC family P-type ATPase [Patescibacteria group bacterium]|jgi:Ca2+-transporting ATPase|nr:HAD-IC family P-type ATPase [Patescibacteria group bacterium]
MLLNNTKNKNKTINWHALESEKIFSILQTRNSGLNDKEAAKRQDVYGLNKLEEYRKTNLLRLFLKQFKSPLIYILLIGGIITIFLKDFTDSIVIFGTIIINSFIGFFQEKKTNQIFQQLQKYLKNSAKVKREGLIKEITAEEVVPGDIVILEMGQRVPADGRIIEANNLKINESILTGEWLAKSCTTESLPEDTPLADRDNMAYMGTLVEEGRGVMVVTTIGKDTEFGNLGFILQDIEKDKTPFQRKVEYFSKFLGLIISIFVLSIFILGIINNRPFIEMLTVSVATAVAAIPEGLPLVVTVIFTFGMREIFKKRGLVKKIVAAEVLGSTSVICTDKTGTLTKATMQVSGIYTPTRSLIGDTLKKHKFLNIDGEASELIILKTAILACDAFIENPDDPIHQWISRGRPTERAVVELGYQMGIKKHELEKKYPRIDELAFSPQYKYSAAINEIDKNEIAISYLGAPERLLEFSQNLFYDGQIKKINESERKKINKLIEDLMMEGLRLVGVAFCKINKNKYLENFQKQKTENSESYFKEQLLKSGIFLGFIALKDPIREDVVEAIKKCKEAGMRVILVTGDHKNTALSVAKEIGLEIKDSAIIEGKELATMEEEDFLKKVGSINLYARVEPQQKLKIIEALQQKGEIVAMTGDGVNDALALKKANIGVALGSGTAIAKESADLILLDDSFSIIILAVEEGRHIIDNIRKTLTYLLTGGFTELVLIGLSVIFGLPLPVLSAQILWKNLIESTPPSLSLTFEPKEENIMRRKPESPVLPLLNKEMKFIIFIVGMLTNLVLFFLFYYLLKIDYPLERIRTIMFVGLAIDSFFFIFSCKNLRKNIWQYSIFNNKYLIITVLSCFLVLVSAVYLPFFNWLLKTTPLNYIEWIILIMFGVLNLTMIEVSKYYFIKQKLIN